MVLCGCGNLDGSDTIEAVSLILALSEKGIKPEYFGPTDEAPSTFNYNTRDVDTSEERYMNKESTRITRTAVQDVKKLKAADFDAVILVGGSGWIRNVSSFEAEKNIGVCKNLFVVC